jgi:signal transduction histidine kinase
VIVGWWRALAVLVQDSVITVAFTAVALTPINPGVILGQFVTRRTDAVGLALELAQCLPLMLRRVRPTLSLAVVGLAFAVDQSIGYPPSFTSVGVVLALYSAGAYVERYRRTTMAVGTLGYAVLAIVLHGRGSPESALDFGTFYLVLVACWGAGAWVRAERWRSAERHRQAAASAAAEERARIARELHDVVTHHVTAMVVQADATQFLLADRDRVTVALTAVSDTGRRALTELRNLLDVLHTGRAPTAGTLRDLVDQACSAGQPVELTEEGTPVAGGDGVALATYRVVQEALTNARKHAPGERTAVRVRYGADEIDVDVTNDGPVVALSDRPGHGLAGLRARVGGFGGELRAGAREGGGFTVHARIPVGERQ